MSGFNALASYGITVRPIEAWPGRRTPESELAWSRFGASLDRTLETLERELRFLNARRVVLQLDIEPSQIRNDGLPRATAKLPTGGVILAFDSEHGALRYACDRFTSYQQRTGPRRSGSDWQENLRAITLGLEKLRAIQRYGIADDAQQYRGYAQLPSGIAMPPAMTPNEAAKFVADHGGAGEQAYALVIDQPETARTWYRIAVKRLHPDVKGGDAELFQRLQQARDVLGVS